MQTKLISAMRGAAANYMGRGANELMGKPLPVTQGESSELTPQKIKDLPKFTPKGITDKQVHFLDPLTEFIVEGSTHTDDSTEKSVITESSHTISDIPISEITPSCSSGFTSTDTSQSSRESNVSHVESLGT
jgi:hypothetical protein